MKQVLSLSETKDLKDPSLCSGLADSSPAEGGIRNGELVYGNKI